MKFNKKAVFAAAATVGLGLATYQTQAFGLLSNDNDLSDCDNISLQEVKSGGLVFDANLCRYDSHGNIVVDPGNLFVTKETADIAPIENVIGHENAQIAKRILSDIETLENRFPSSSHNFVEGMQCDKSINVTGVEINGAYTQVNVETRKPYFQPMGFESGCKIQQHAVFGLGDVSSEENNGIILGMDENTMIGLKEIEEDFGSAAAGKIKDLYYAAKNVARLDPILQPPSI